MGSLARPGPRTEGATIAIQFILRFTLILIEEFNLIKAAQEAWLAYFARRVRYALPDACSYRQHHALV